MKRIFAVMCVAIFALFTGCKNSEEKRVQEEKTHARVLQENANYAVRAIQYTKDLRTNLCFAYFDRGRGSITTVPCEAIPSHLLTVGKLDDTK